MTRLLGAFPDVPAELFISREADVYPRNHPDRAVPIDSTIGEDSAFDRSFGNFAAWYRPGDGHSACRPARASGSVSGENTRFVRGWCLDVHDLAIAKYVAGTCGSLHPHRCTVESDRRWFPVDSMRLRTAALYRQQAAGARRRTRNSGARDSVAPPDIRAWPARGLTE